MSWLFYIVKSAAVNIMYMYVLVAQLCLTLYDLMYCSLPLSMGFFRQESWNGLCSEHWGASISLSSQCTSILAVGKPRASLVVQDGKESVCSAGDLDLIPLLGRPLEEGNGYPLQHSCLEDSMD